MHDLTGGGIEIDHGRLPGTVRIRDAFAEPTPRNVLRVEQVADVGAGQAHLVRASAIVIERVGIADQCPIDNVAGDISERGHHTMSLTGDQIDWHPAPKAQTSY